MQIKLKVKGKYDTYTVIVQDRRCLYDLKSAHYYIYASTGYNKYFVLDKDPLHSLDYISLERHSKECILNLIKKRVREYEDRVKRHNEHLATKKTNEQAWLSFLAQNEVIDAYVD